jgi:exodeoxyribonuclease-3
MRVVFWNIRAGGGARADAIARQLARWTPDVVALSEFRCTPPSSRLGAALAAQGLAHQRRTTDPARPSANCLLLASRWPLRLVRGGVGPGEPGRWLLAALAAPRPLAVGVMHVPNRVSGRKYVFLDAVLAVVSGWRRGPAMVVGDTNTGWPGLDEETAVFNRREERWLDTLERQGWVDAFRLVHGAARAYTWYSPNGQNGFRVDQAFVNADLRWRLKNAWYQWGRGRAALSDHAALLVDFEP